VRDVEAATADRRWVDWAVARLHADARRSADTHLLRLPTPPGSPVDIYMKDESTHPTGSLKHRLARSLFLYALCNGDIDRGSTVVEASSGSTAISEAYFARLVGLPFVAVVARSTSPGKIALIEREGGRCEFVESAGEVYDTARRLADELGGHYLDQFTNAERATDWRQQQHRRIDLRPAGGRTPPRAGLDRRRRGYRRHERHHRPLPALPRPRHAVGRRRPRGLGLPAGLRRRGPARTWLAH